MKNFKLFLTLSLITILAVPAWAATVSLTSSALGLDNGDPFSTTTQNGITVSGDKGDNSNAPKYYTSGDAVRFYAKNTMTVSGTGITSIVVTYGSKSNAISSSSPSGIGTYNTGSKTQTWTGTATNSITFTFGGTSGNDQIKSIEVTTSGGSTPYTVTLSKNGSTTDITGCTGTYTLPTTGEHVVAACEGWSWHCWANTLYPESTTAPSTTQITTMSSAGTAYAVYKHSETGGGSGTSTLAAASQEWNNADPVTSKTIDGVTYSFDKNGGTAPAYYTSGGVRIYANNKLTISSSSTITAITFTYTQSKYTQSCVDGGTVTSGNWSGSATSVEFTNETGGQVRFSQIVVTTGGGTTTTYTSTPSCMPPTQCATPTFMPAAGSYSSAQSVTISCTTSGATIHYTTDGTTPTTSSPTYSGSIDVSSDMTIKAIAEKSGMTNSDVASATYTITASCSADITLSFKGGSHTSSWTNCTLPTASDIADEDKCDGWDFAGWSETAISSTTDAPTLITSKTTDGTVYAVYSQGEGGNTVVTLDGSSITGFGSGTDYTSGSYVNGDITISSNGAFSTSNFRVGKSKNMTISTSDGKITRIDITCSGNSYKFIDSQLSYSGTIGTYTNSTGVTSITFTNGNTDNPARMTEIKIEYTGGSGGSGTKTYTTSCATISSTELEIVEWNPDYINIMVPDPSNASVVIEDKNENKVTKKAEEVFFSKYFEASGSVKMLAIYNGTGEPQDPTKLRFRIVNEDGSSEHIVNLADHVSSTDLPDGKELIFYSWNYSAATDQNIMNCAESTPGVDMSTWIEIKWNSYTSTYPGIIFGGNEAIVLEKQVGANWEVMDIIGALSDDGTVADITNTGKINAYMDAKGWYTYNGNELGQTKTDNYFIATVRCLLVRNFDVTSGKAARNKTTGNWGTGDFKTLASEWFGHRVGVSTGEYALSCAAFTEVGKFDYSTSYQQYEHVTTVTEFNASNQNPDGSYKVEIDQLDTLACTKLKINLYEGGVVTATNFYSVPIMISGDKDTKDGVFFDKSKTEEICKTCDVVILKNSTLTKAPDGGTDEIDKIRTLTVYPGGKLVVPQNSGTNTYNFTVDSIMFRVEGDTLAPHAVLNGNLVVNNQKLTVSRRIMNKRYYFLSLPYNCYVNDIYLSNGEKPTKGTDFEIKYFDGANRANTGNLKSWAIVPADGVLEAGVGYNVAVGTPYASELVFPMALPSTNLSAEETGKSPAAVTVHDFTGPTTIENHHWNLIAHPYVDRFDPYAGDLIKGGILEWNGYDNWERHDAEHIYLTIPNYKKETPLLASDYTQKLASTIEGLDPFLAVFVQGMGYGDVTFSQDNRKKSAPGRHLAAKSEYADESIFVGVTLSGNGGKDQTNLRIRPDFNEEYQLGYDLTKFGTTSEERPVLYMRNGGYNLAFRAINDNNAAISQPMGVYCKAAGTYTFALSNDYSRDNIEAVYLYDAETQQTINLMNDTYEFTTTGNLNTGERFYLSAVVRRPAPQVTTDNELVNEELPLTRKILINGHVFIQHGGKLFDITGKEMLNH